VGYLQTIKSPEMYVSVMRVFMFPMPDVERDEACQEVRQHLEALAEDFQVQGASVEDATVKAVKQFGLPSKVGREISQKWVKGNQSHPNIGKLRVFKSKEKALGAVTLLQKCFWGLGFFWVISHTLTAIVLLSVAVGLGISDGVLEAHREGANERTGVVQGMDIGMDMRQRMDRGLKRAKTTLKQQLSEDKTLRGRLRHVLYRLVEPDVSRFVGLSSPATSLPWKPAGVGLGLAYLTVLLLWPGACGWQLTLKQILILVFVSGRTRTVSQVLVNRLLLRGRTPQM